jgi:hypothetical protein
VTIVECCREQDVLDALAGERWPERVPEELRLHAAGCAICTDLIAAVQPILADRVDLSNEGHIPSSGVMWWRAQMRARQEAAREAARPITVAQIVGVVCTLGVAAMAIAWLSPVMRVWLIESTAGMTANLRSVELGSVLQSQGWLVLLMGLVWLLLAPLVIYFAVAED